MANYPGGADEVVKVLWISEFQDHAKGLQASMVRARQALEQATRDQQKNHALRMRSAKEAATAAVADQEAQKKRLVLLRELSLKETQDAKSKAKVLRELEAEKGRLAKAAEKREQALTDAIDAETEKRIAIVAREQAARRQHANRFVTAEKDRIAREVAALEAANKSLAVERETEGTLPDRKKEIRRIQAENREEIKAIKTAGSARVKELVLQAEAENNEVNKVTRSRNQQAKREARRFATEEFSKNDPFLKMITDRQNKVNDLIAALERLENAERDLAALRKEFPERIERQMRAGGLHPSQRVIERNTTLAMKDMNREARQQEFSLMRLDKAIAQVKYQFRATGRVSEDAFERLARAERSATNAGVDFGDVTKRAGIQVRGFAGEKQREIKFLKTNEEMLGRNRQGMNRFSTALREIKNGLRLSTNEMILFGRTMSLLAIPSMAAAISVLAQALTTAAGGATALVASVGPLAGQIAGIVPLAFSAAQSFSVWHIAMTNLGKSSTSFGKILQTSLSASTDQFQLLLKDLPNTARDFAVQMRFTLFPVFDKLRTELQKKLFPAITDAIKFAAPGFKGFDKILVGTASALGNLFRQIGGRLGAPGFGKDLQKAGENTNRWVRELTPGVLHLVDAFRQLTIAAAPLVDHFVKLTDQFAHWLDIQLTFGRMSGNLQDFFHRSNSVLDTTLSLLGNLGKALLNIGRIANGSLGGQMLRDLQGQAKALRDWTESAKGSRKIVTYFQELKKPLYEAGRFARDLFKAFFQITNNTDFFDLLNKLRTEALPALVEMFKQINKTFTPALIDLVTSMFETIAALGKQGGLTNLVKALEKLSDIIRGIANSPAGGVIFKLLAGVAIFRTLRFAAAISGVTLLTRNFYALATAIGRASGQAGLFNTFLARRGVRGFNPGDTAIIGGNNLPAPISAYSRGPGGSVLFPNRGVPEGTKISGVGASGFTFSRAATTADIEAEIQAQQRLRGMALLRRNADIAGIAGGLGLSTAGLLTGGKAGSILTYAGLGASTGAAIGSAFGPGPGTAIGAGVGAAVGAIGGFVISLRGGTSAMEKFSDATNKTAHQVADARARLGSAVRDLRGAVNARDEAQANLRAQQRRLRVLRRTPGAQAQVEQQQFAVRDAQEVLRQARGRVRADLRDIRTYGPVVVKGRKTYLDELLGTREELQKKITDIKQKAEAGIRHIKFLGLPDADEQIRDIRAAELTGIKGVLADWHKELKKDMDGPDGPLANVARHLDAISRKTGKLTSKKQTIQIETKLIGPTPLVRKLLNLANAHIYVQFQDIPTRGRDRRAYGGRIPGAPVAADTVPALLSPGEFVVTGDGERMLEGMTGMPGVLDYVGAMQRPHFNVGGRVRRYAYGGRVDPYNITGIAQDALSAALGGTSYNDLVSQAIDSATAAMAGADTSQSSRGGIPKSTPPKLRARMTAMLHEGAVWASKGVKSAPRIGLGIKGRFLQTSDEKQSPIVPHRTGLDPGAVISDIIRAGYGVKFPDLDPNQLGHALQVGKSKYVTVFLRQGAAQEYDAAIKIGNKGYGFSGGKFTRRDIGGSSSTGGLNWGQYHIPGWPLRSGGRVMHRKSAPGGYARRFRFGGPVGEAGGVSRYDQQSEALNQQLIEALKVEIAARRNASQHVRRVAPQHFETGSSGGTGASGGSDFGLAAQARERLSLTAFANNVKNNSIKSLAALSKSIQAQLRAMGNALTAAELKGNVNQANKIQAQMTVLESKLQIVMDAIGNVVNQLARRIAASAAKITEIQDRLQDRILRTGIDPAGASALKLTIDAQKKIVAQDALQLRLVKKQLADLRAAGASQDVLDQYIAAVAAARQALRDAAASLIADRRALLRRRFERRETRAAVQEQLAELKLQNIATQAQIGGAYDGGAGAQAAYIYSNVIPALQKQIAAVEATLAHAKKLKLTEDEKNQKLIELQELNNQLAQYQLQAQQESNALLAKTLGKLTFEFNGQSFSDMIGSGVGV